MPDRPSGRTRTTKPKGNPWVLARKITQGLALIAFLTAVALSRSAEIPPKLAGLPARISPLAMLANLLSSKTFQAGFAISLILFLSSFIVGRAWCGWLCPVGTLLDLFPFSRINKPAEPPQNLRKAKYGILIVILVSALLGNLTLLVFDPLTIFVRSTTLSFLPLLDKMFFAVEKVLIKVPFMSDAVFKFDTWLRPTIFPMASYAVQFSVLFGFFFVGLILLNLIAERFWCRYLCPLGAMLGLPAKLALFQRRNNSACSSCGLCAKACPTATIDAEKDYASDPSECTLCMNCVDCHKDATSFTPKFQLAPRQSYDPDRRTFLSSIGISVAATALLNTEWLKHKPQNFLLRPPGVLDESDFISKCLRCGVCIDTCPSQALQADVHLSGLEGFATPILVPRIGFCIFSCNLCGQACPVQAIPNLPLEQKQATPLGRAYIDHNRCLAWSDHQNCIVCEEMCPLPEKAISLQTSEFIDQTGNPIQVRLPVVDRNRCIGCGTCENKCPVSGDAAIRVYTL